MPVRCVRNNGTHRKPWWKISFAAMIVASIANERHPYQGLQKNHCGKPRQQNGRRAKRWDDRRDGTWTSHERSFWTVVFLFFFLSDLLTRRCPCSTRPARIRRQAGWVQPGFASGHPLRGRAAQGCPHHRLERCCVAPVNSHVFRGP